MMMRPLGASSWRNRKQKKLCAGNIFQSAFFPIAVGVGSGNFLKGKTHTCRLIQNIYNITIYKYGSGRVGRMESP